MGILIRRSGFEGHEDVWFQSMLQVSFQPQIRAIFGTHEE